MTYCSIFTIQSSTSNCWLTTFSRCWLPLDSQKNEVNNMRDMNWCAWILISWLEHLKHNQRSGTHEKELRFLGKRKQQDWQSCRASPTLPSLLAGGAYDHSNLLTYVLGSVVRSIGGLTHKTCLCMRARDAKGLKPILVLGARITHVRRGRDISPPLSLSLLYQEISFNILPL